MYDTVLVPTDGSDHAVRAADHAAALADRFGATVNVLAAVDVESAAGAFDAGGVTESFVETLEQQAKADVESVTDAIGDEVPTATELIRGRPEDVVVDYATDNDVDLIAMGTHGRTGIDRVVAGSVTERVLRRGPVPVLTARHSERTVSPTYDDVAIPYDGSDAASAALDHAVAIAGATDATLHAVSVVEIPATAGHPELTLSPGVLETHDEHAEATADEAADRAREADVDTTTAIVNGAPADAVLDYVADNDVDMIAMGTHGRTGIGRYLLGSTTERVVRRADPPVVAVNVGE